MKNNRPSLLDDNLIAIDISMERQLMVYYRSYVPQSLTWILHGQLNYPLYVQLGPRLKDQLILHAGGIVP